MTESLSPTGSPFRASASVSSATLRPVLLPLLLLTPPPSLLLGALAKDEADFCLQVLRAASMAFAAYAGAFAVAINVYAIAQPDGSGAFDFVKWWQ